MDRREFMKYMGASTFLASVAPQLLLADKEPEISYQVIEIPVNATLVINDTLIVLQKGKHDFYIVTSIEKEIITVMSLSTEPKTFPDTIGNEFLLGGRQSMGPTPPPHMEDPCIWPLYEITEIIDKSSGNSYTIKYKPVKFKDNGTE